MGSSPTGHPTKNPLMLFIGGFFYLAGVSQWDSNKTALTHQRQSNQQPSGLLVSLRVPISRNVYQDKCCADALHRRIFLFGGVSQWDSNKTALTHQRQSNQQPSGLLVSLRVPISRNVYQDKCCADALHRRFFYLVGYPSGTRTARHYFLLKKHVQNTSGRNGSCVLCTCFLLFGIHPNGQRLICCRICAISALE